MTEEMFSMPTGADTWGREMSNSGFDVLCETSEIIMAIVSQEQLTRDRIGLLSGCPDGQVARYIASGLAQQGYMVEIVGLDSELNQQEIISILDLETIGGLLADITPENFALFKGLVARLQADAAGMLWLTRPCQIRCAEPQYASILGLARTLRNESAVDFVTLELDVNMDVPSSCRSEALDGICSVFQRFQHHRHRARVRMNVKTDPDYEYAMVDGMICIPRFHWVSVTDGLASNQSKIMQAPKRLEIGKRGTLKSLHWIEELPKNTSLKGNQVLVHVRAVGVNFKDVLTAMGITEGQKTEGNGLGCECAGVVTETGPDVGDLRVGDRVCVAASNTYTTCLQTTSNHCVKIPPELDFEDAATMPCVYGTVIHGLLDLARLEQGQSVLIHSACGGIGIAALQLCRLLGVTIFATVGTPDKVEFLVKTFGVRRAHIFGSRDSRFLPDLMRETGGRGVDVVLNSLSGDLLHATWKCVAEFGCMIDIDKRDFIGQGRLEMDRFEANRTYFGVDLAHMYVRRPSNIRRILDRMMELYRQGAIRPIQPVTLLDAEQVEEAFRSMQKGQHIGKLVVRVPQDISRLPSIQTRDAWTARSDASYVLAGGLGGLGRSVASWLVEHGARSLIFLSRSADPTRPKTRALVEELTAAGCGVQLVKGSVACLDDIYGVIRQARAPIAGVMQMSMVLRDSAYDRMTYEDWVEATAPKVSGTWNLHQALTGAPLDFFILFSSISGTVGNPGQANYASANTFLDAFVQFRHANRLPASVLDVGVLGDVGYVSEHSATMEHFKAKAAYVLSEQALLDSLELAIKRSHASRVSGNGYRYVNESQIGIGFRSTQPILSPGNRTVWKRDARMRIYRNSKDNHEDRTSSKGATDGEDTLKNLLTAAANDHSILRLDSSAEVIAQHIAVTLRDFIVKEADEIDTKASPGNLGLDSLVATELKNWCRQRFGLSVSVLQIMRATSIQQLGTSIAAGLVARLNAGAV